MASIESITWVYKESLTLMYSPNINEQMNLVIHGGRQGLWGQWRTTRRSSTLWTKTRFDTRTMWKRNTKKLRQAGEIHNLGVSTHWDPTQPTLINSCWARNNRKTATNIESQGCLHRNARLHNTIQQPKMRKTTASQSKDLDATMIRSQTTINMTREEPQPVRSIASCPEEPISTMHKRPTQNVSGDNRIANNTRHYTEDLLVYTRCSTSQ